MASRPDLPAPDLFHGTRVGFGRGGFLVPVGSHGKNQRPGHQGEESTAYVYLTTDREMAAEYAMDHPGRGPAKVLTVVPTEPIELDPSRYDGERGHQYRTKGWCRVVNVELA